MKLTYILIAVTYFAAGVVTTASAQVPADGLRLRCTHKKGYYDERFRVKAVKETELNLGLTGTIQSDDLHDRFTVMLERKESTDNTGLLVAHYYDFMSWKQTTFEAPMSFEIVKIAQDDAEQVSPHPMCMAIPPSYKETINSDGRQLDLVEVKFCCELVKSL